LPEFPSLYSFYFMSDDLSPEMVEQIAKSATIQHLYLKGKRNDSSGMRYTLQPNIVNPLHQMENLRKLDLDGRAERETLEAIAGITSLKSLKFDGIVTSGEDLQVLARMPRLRELDMGYVRTPEEDAYQRAHGNRAYWDLTDATIPSVDLSALKEVRSLRKLVMPAMRDNRLEQAGIDQLDQVTEVVTKADYDSGNLEPLASMPNLRSLRLERVKRMQETLAIVKEFEQLECLSIGGRHFKNAESDAMGLTSLKEMPYLVELELSEPMSLISSKSRQSLSELTNLKKLTVYCRGQVPPEHQAILDELTKNNPGVEIVVNR
ncbi:MAG: hypothetical protein KDA65_12570, partial [Planctomycetaceae bacterium]|nr:hypothetical protein [Planctomycetaceae bacterium]